MSEYLLRHNLCCSYLNCIRHKINIITLLTSNAFNNITEITDIINIIEIMRITDTMYITIHALEILPILLKLPVLLKLPILLKLSVLLIYITLPALLIILILLKWPVILTMSMLKKIPASLILLIFLHLPTLLALPILLKSTTLLKLPTSLKLPTLLTFTNDIQTWRHSYKVFLSCSETSHMSMLCVKVARGFFSRAWKHTWYMSFWLGTQYYCFRKFLTEAFDFCWTLLYPFWIILLHTFAIFSSSHTGNVQDLVSQLHQQDQNLHTFLPFPFEHVHIAEFFQHWNLYHCNHMESCNFFITQLNCLSFHQTI